MRLTRLKVENHKRFADLDIEVREHLVLVGANDVGKSSILRCLDLALGASTAQLYSQIVAEDFRDPNQPFTIEVQIQSFSDDEKALYPDEINIDAASGESSMLVRLTATIDESETITIERRALGSGTTRQLSREQVAGLGWKFLSATTQNRDLREDRKSQLDEILKAVDLGTEKLGFEEIATSLTNKLSDSKVLGSLRSDLAGQLSKALPEPVDKDDLSFVPGAAADDDVLSDVRLRVSKAGVPRDLSQQSDGNRALFAIAFYDLISAGANVVGIDEPEIHLHPTSQRSLARLLQSSPNQKIIATHSTDIVSVFEPDSIVVVRLGGDVVQPRAGFLTTDEKMFVRWWVRERLEPLTSRRIVVVEGLSDRIILERVADLTGRNLDRLGVSIIEASGNRSMPSIEKLFGPTGFGVPLLQLMDEDAAVEIAGNLGVEITDLPQRSIWVSRVDLEDEYVRALGPDVVLKGLNASSMLTRNQLAHCIPTGPGETYTNEDVAKICRSHKVEAAIVVANLLTDVSARKISSFEQVLIEASMI